MAVSGRSAADEEFPGEKAIGKPTGRGYRMDYGSLLSYTINCKGASDRSAPDNLALKGVAVRLGRSNEAAICFDTELMRYAAGWTGGLLDISRTHLDTYKGSQEAFVEGTIQFHTKPLPGWAKGKDFSDPRALHTGPLPASSAKHKGLYRNGDRVIFRYSVAGNEIWESPDCATTNGLTFFTRTFHIERTTAPLTLRLCDLNEEMAGEKNAPSVIQTKAGEVVGVRGTTATFSAIIAPKLRGAAAPPVAELEVADRTRIQLSLAPVESPLNFRVVIWTGPPTDATAHAAHGLLEESVENVKELCVGAAAQWTAAVQTKGRLGAGGPYAVDTLTAPENNPWNSWLRFGAFDFFSDGRAAIATWNGDVWIVSGIDERLENLRWKRLAAGLFEPLGLKIVNDDVYVLGRDQITRLHDLNHDGEADFYENFNNDAPTAPTYHGFAMELQTDSTGNFYYTRCGQRVDPTLPLHGGVVRISKDGSKSELIATGLRAANGLSVGPHDEITAADNQGNWVPSSRIDLIRPGGFYGYVPHARRKEAPTDFEKPICWLPMAIDNSSGSQVWVTSEKWGPFNGQLLHTSYGKAALFLVMAENVAGRPQGGVVQFPLRFDSGIMRARFHPRDGQLYVCGLKGWQTTGVRDGAFQRVRYAGGAVRMPRALRVRADGVELAFACELDETSATDEQNYAIEQWNYLWSEKYGSPDFSVKNPIQQGHDPVAIRSVKLLADRKTVVLQIPEIVPVMQMKIRFRIKTADGTLMAQEIYNTINQVPDPEGRR